MKIDVPKDQQWQQARLQRWEQVWKKSFVCFGVSKREERIENEIIEATKQWYLYGDLAPLMAFKGDPEKEHALELLDVIVMCPATDLTQYQTFFQAYALWCSEHKLSFWMQSTQGNDACFISAFFALYSYENTDSTPEIYSHMLGMLLPDENGVVTFGLQLGLDNWRPTHEFSLPDYAFDIFLALDRHLFNEEPSQIYSHIVGAMPLIANITQLDLEYYGKELLPFKPRRSLPPPATRYPGGAGQTILRRMVGHIHGYLDTSGGEEGPLLHNDSVVESQLRALLESLPLPPQYFELVDFIKEHPNNFVKYSEQKNV